jgi:hypothetical protein
MEHLTSKNFPMVLLNRTTLEPKEYEFTDSEPIAGKSIVLSKAGLPYLFMGIDQRREPAEQIIVKRVGNPDMAFLPIDCLKTIRLLNYEYV